MTIRLAMYSIHSPVIADHGMGSPRGLQDIVIFAVSTIQTPISRAATVALDIHEHGSQSKYLNPSRRLTVEFIEKHKRSMYRKLKASESPENAVGLLIQTPGLGIVKAAFVAQLLGYDVGCIDRHNVALYNVKSSTITVPSSLKPATRERKIEAYVELCREIGGSEFLWDQWCAHVANSKWNRRLPTAELVSQEHVLGCRCEN